MLISPKHREALVTGPWEPICVRHHGSDAESKGPPSPSSQLSKRFSSKSSFGNGERQKSHMGFV